MSVPIQNFYSSDSCNCLADPICMQVHSTKPMPKVPTKMQAKHVKLPVKSYGTNQLDQWCPTSSETSKNHSNLAWNCTVQMSALDCQKFNVSSEAPRLTLAVASVVLFHYACRDGLQMKQSQRQLAISFFIPILRFCDLDILLAVCSGGSRPTQPLTVRIRAESCLVRQANAPKFQVKGSQVSTVDRRLCRFTSVPLK